MGQSSSERSERSVRFELNLRIERVRYVSERETNVQPLKNDMQWFLVAKVNCWSYVFNI